MVELNRAGAERPCDCVFRAIFRACYRRFRECAIFGTQGSSVSVECTHGPSGKHFYSRKREEYAADFCLVTRRVLTDFEHQLFRFTFLLGADSKLCSRRLGIDRGNYFHLLYRIEEKLGREFAEVRPYALFPLDEYFGGPVRAKKPDVPKRKLRLRREALERPPMVPRRPMGEEGLAYCNSAVPLSA